MARDKNTLSKAVVLLEESIDALARIKVSKSSQGSARELSSRLRRARELLEGQLARPDPDWRSIAELLTEAAKWLAKILFDNIP